MRGPYYTPRMRTNIRALQYGDLDVDCSTVQSRHGSLNNSKCTPKHAFLYFGCTFVSICIHQKTAATDVTLNLNGHFGYQKVVIHTTQELGSGSYGSVVKATLDHVPCAAKVIQRIFLNPKQATSVARFEEDCCNLKHPCLVKFLCVVQVPNTKKLIFLMELMKENLTKFLKRSPSDVPYHTQVNVAYDIALAVAHLHICGILHRNLSSNNILLNDIHRAKVTDFGMSQIADGNPFMAHSVVTQCPGTLVYMPPEALCLQPHYSEKADTFSIGVLLVQIVTRSFPAPTDASVEKEEPTSPTGKTYAPVSEVIRRKADIDKIPPSHGFLPIAHNCLKDKSQERPTAAQLCQSLCDLKMSQAYKNETKTNVPCEVGTRNYI